MRIEVRELSSGWKTQGEKKGEGSQKKNISLDWLSCIEKEKHLN